MMWIPNTEDTGMDTQARPAAYSRSTAQVVPPVQIRDEATYQDLLDAPSDMVAELINGTLHTFPRPASPHARASTRLCTIIDGAFGDAESGVKGSKPGGWLILHEPQLRLGEMKHALVPDITGWRFETMDPDTDVTEFAIAPDWVCEVLSRSTEEIDLNEKKKIYAREGVPYLWFLDPRKKTLEILENRGGRFIRLGLLEGDTEVSMPPFDRFNFKLSALWRRKRS